MTTTGRGYGSRHQQRRTVLLEQLNASPYVEPCPLCGLGMKYGQRLDLDHTIPLQQDPWSVGDRLVHASCNRSRGAKEGNQ